MALVVPGELLIADVLIIVTETMEARYLKSGMMQQCLAVALKKS